ncbi:MAG: ATP-binding protein [Dissulfurispiraceae bacterium]
MTQMILQPCDVLQELIPEAEYHPAKLPEHAGNPLIEALPSFCLASEMVDEFGRFPYCSSEETQNLSVAERMFAVSRLNNWLEPLTAHFELIEQIGLNVRSGYVNRNPLNQEYRKSLAKLYHEAMEGQICCIGDPGASAAPSISLFGVSGTGKTTVVERALWFLPRAVRHSKYGFVQVGWLKLECPPDGSPKQFLLDILEKLDERIGTQYREEIAKNVNSAAIDSLIRSIAKILASHHVGMLVIDEIQNLLDANGVGQAKMINMLVSYVNEVKIPMVIIGTPRALKMLEGTFRVARRVGDHGSFVWDALPYEEEYMYFLERLFKYQWTLTAAPLTKEISKTFYERTQGIHVLTVRLSQLSQLRAIRSGTEQLTEKLINEVADDKFKLMAPMLKALKQGSKKAIVLYEDLLHKGVKEISEEVGREAKLSLLKEKAQSRNQGSFERIRTVSALVHLGFEESHIQKIVTDLFDTDPNLRCDKAVRMILESLHSRPVGKGDLTGESLMKIVQSGEASGKSPVDSLNSTGLVGSHSGKV